MKYGSSLVPGTDSFVLDRFCGTKEPLVPPVGFDFKHWILAQSIPLSCHSCCMSQTDKLRESKLIYSKVPHNYLTWNIPHIQCGEIPNKNGVYVKEAFLKFVICLSHMIEQVYWLNSSYWPIFNLHAIFVRNSSALDINNILLTP